MAIRDYEMKVERPMIWRAGGDPGGNNLRATWWGLEKSTRRIKKDANGDWNYL